MSEQTLDPLANLGRAVIMEAVRDAKDGCDAAKEWLQGGACTWLEYIGLEQDFVIKWIDDGCNVQNSREARAQFRKDYQSSSTQYKRKAAK